MATLIAPPLPDAGLYPSLGPQLVTFIEEHCVHGPGPKKGDPVHLDDEKRALIYRAYELHPRNHRLAGQRVFGRCVWELRKGLAKTETAAWVTFCELHPAAPVRFAGFDDDGNPIGKPVRSPFIPMMANTEEQVSTLAFGILRYVCENGPDAALFDSNLERVVRLGPGGEGSDGMAVPVSTAPASRDGARTTFQHFDEPHRLVLPNQRGAVEIMLENLHKLPSQTPWCLYTSTAGAPGQGSVEEDARLEAEKVVEGDAPNSRLFYFARWADVDDHPHLDTVEQRIAAIADANGPFATWLVPEFENVAKAYDDVGKDRSQWERLNLNRWKRSSDGAYDMKRVRALAQDTEGSIPKQAFITVGFDGAKFKDATAIVITEIPTGKQQLVGLWERPADARDWEVDEREVDSVMASVFKDYEVWRLYADPPYYESVVADWAGRWPDRAIKWRTQSTSQAALAARVFGEAIDAGDVHWVGSDRDRADMVRHISHAGRRELNLRDDQGQRLWNLQKLNGQDQNKFDACMAGCLSWQARLDAITAGARPRGRGMPRRLY